MQKKKEFREGLRDGLPIALGYLAVSFAFGIYGANGGLSAGLLSLFSMSNLTSAGQFAGLRLILSGAPYVEFALITLVINARYLLMSLSLSQKLDASFTLKQRLLAGFGVTDEIFAVAVSKKRRLPAAYLYGLILLPLFGWTIGTLLGALMGDVLPKLITSALGIALYAMFIAILVPPARKSKAVLWVVLLSAAISCVFRYVPLLSHISSGWVTILCAVAASLFGALAFPMKKEEEL